jgi:glutamyl-tRNA reductase
MDLFVVGVSHHTAPLSFRERMAVPSEQLPHRLSEFRDAAHLHEAVILSTCNRTEWYGVCEDASISLPAALRAVTRYGRFSPSETELSCYRWLDRHAVAHLFRVAAGLDSMVLGESEITAQVKQAYTAAQGHGSTGPVTHRLLQKALHCAKLLRATTGLAQGHASIGAVVAAAAAERFGPRLPGCDVLLWGAGKAAETTIRHLLKAGVHRLSIVNRTTDKARDLAAQWQARWLAWEQAQDALATVDVAVICTQAPHPVVTAATAADVMRRRAGRPLWLIDLSVPRNVDPACGRVPGVRVSNIDDLHTVTQCAINRRRQALVDAEQMIRERVEQFWRWWKPMVSEMEVASCGLLD